MFFLPILYYNHYVYKSKSVLLFLRRTCLLLFTFTSFFLLVSVFDWFTLFLLNWCLGLFFCFFYQFISAYGLITLVVCNSLALCLKSWQLLLSINPQFSLVMSLGTYGFIFDNAPLSLEFMLDFYGLSYITLTLSIGVWASLFAFSYMRSEPRIYNFIVLLYFFLLSMVLLLCSSNFCSLLLGWELIGCFSFLLINFWTTRIATAKSAFKAFTFNKLSDLCLLTCFIISLHYLPGFSLSELNNFSYLLVLNVYVFNLKISLANIFFSLIMVGSFCKSAQFGFHVWLPDSMEAPVPASALIHSATLVSAGIYLMGRFWTFSSLSGISLCILTHSSLTALYGGVVAAYQTDLKRILAYSTISHCGFMFCSLSLNNVLITLLYLHLHGWFKSLSFMCVGNIIFKSNGYQDSRRMGGLLNTCSLEFLVLLVSLSSLASLPFSLGFFNKHFLLVVLQNNSFEILPFMFLTLASFTGIFYSFNILKSVFWGPFKGHKSVHQGNLNFYNNLNQTNNPVSFSFLLISFVLTISLAASYFVLISGNSIVSVYTIHTGWGFFYPVLYLTLVFSLFKLQNTNLIMFLIVLKLLYVL